MEPDLELEALIGQVLSLEEDYPRVYPIKRPLERPGWEADSAPGLTGQSPEPVSQRAPKRARPSLSPAESSGPARGGGSRKRASFSPDQLAFLRAAFHLSPYPDFVSRLYMAQVTGIPESRVQVWFQNRRARHLPKAAAKTTAAQPQCHGPRPPAAPTREELTPEEPPHHHQEPPDLHLPLAAGSPHATPSPQAPWYEEPRGAPTPQAQGWYLHDGFLCHLDFLDLWPSDPQWATGPPAFLFGLPSLGT